MPREMSPNYFVGLDGDKNEIVHVSEEMEETFCGQIIDHKWYILMGTDEKKKYKGCPECFSHLPKEEEEAEAGADEQ